MKGLELIKAAMSLQEVERTPWVPFVGCHAGSLTGVDAIQYFKSADEIVKGANEAIGRYRADGIPVTFDLQIEAEAMGCRLNWAKDNPPAVVSHPLAEGVELSALQIPSCDDGRIPIVMEATRRLRQAHPDLALYGLITGPFTLGLHLLGTDIFMKMFDDPDYVMALMDFCTDTAIAMADYYLDSGADIVALVDPMTSQIDPMSFEMYVSPYCTRIFDHIRSRNKLSSFFVCGNARQNIEVMCACHPDNISIDENISLAYVRDIALANKVSFGGNMKLTVSLLMGTPADCRYDALECLDTGGKRGFILSPGCDVAMATPIENMVAVSDLVYDSYQQDILRATPKDALTIEMLDISHRYDQGKVVIDIITLDSLGCAPCQYMVKAVEKAIEGLEERVEWHEHKVKEQAGLQMMITLGVSNIPTICINGHIEFVSQIPPVSEITQRIQRYL